MILPIPVVSFSGISARRKTMARILVFGSLNIDYTYSVPHIVRPGETLTSTALCCSAGGKGANQAAAAAAAGLDVFMAGRIGRDGVFLLDVLGRYGVDTRFVRAGGTPTGNAIIQVDESGQNSIVLFPGGNREIGEEEIEEAVSFFSAGDILLLQNEINGLGSLIEKASGRGMRVMFNPAPFDDSVFSLPLDKVSMLFVNEIEGAAMAHLSTSAGYDEILGRLSSLYSESGIVLTAGENGAFYGSGTTRFSCSAVKCEAVDTTGAGDTFIGYFIAGCERGYDIPEALRFASAAASIAVSRHGAMESIPFLQEAEDRR